ncbi:hypothetical protein CHS0354_027078 [Potamilus streckersoni]|uniref:Uncharacterized protein n=1 Tax=Potamilus streckersoni TaxID=2493646 RepID=A0AAE0S0Q3_9BIVA|nr:hypothetical protein CHS0354_027078 [Potamilus streckersoni]
MEAILIRPRDTPPPINRDGHYGEDGRECHGEVEVDPDAANHHAKRPNVIAIMATKKSVIARLRIYMLNGCLKTGSNMNDNRTRKLPKIVTTTSKISVMAREMFSAVTLKPENCGNAVVLEQLLKVTLISLDPDIQFFFDLFHNNT